MKLAIAALLLVIAANQYQHDVAERIAQHTTPRTNISRPHADIIPPVDQTNVNTAIAQTLLYSVPSDGQYQVAWNAKVTTAAATSSTLGPLTISYTEPDGTVQTITATGQFNRGGIIQENTSNSVQDPSLGFPLTLNCKGGTGIFYSFGYASSPAGAMQYDLHIRTVGPL